MKCARNQHDRYHHHPISLPCAVSRIGAGDEYTCMKPSAWIKSVYGQFGGLCAYCDRKTVLPSMLPGTRNELTATLDHRQPLSKGGTNSQDNFALACGLCNSLKGNMSFDEWMDWTAKNPGWWQLSKTDRRRSLYGLNGTRPWGASMNEFLADQKAWREMEWPWLKALTRDRVYQVGWGSWRN